MLRGIAGTLARRTRRSPIGTYLFRHIISADVDGSDRRDFAVDCVEGVEGAEGMDCTEGIELLRGVPL